MRRLLAGAAVAAALGGCTPAQTDLWLRWWHRDPEPAEQFANQPWVQRSLVQDWDRDGRVEPEVFATADTNPTEHSDTSFDGDVPDDANWQPDTACSQWASTALDAGFSESEWVSPVSWIMERESRCDPGAYNASGASGLMQIMPFHVGTTCPNGDLFNAWYNLHCAVLIKNAYGWGAWSTY